MTKVNKWFECFDWIWYENVWIRIESVQLKVLNVLAKLIQRFMKIISYNIPYIFCKWTWNIWSMNCINVPYWALSSFLFVDYFSGTLSSGKEWWLGRGMVIIRILLRMLFWTLLTYKFTFIWIIWFLEAI